MVGCAWEKSSSLGPSQPLVACPLCDSPLQFPLGQRRRGCVQLGPFPNQPVVTRVFLPGLHVAVITLWRASQPGVMHEGGWSGGVGFKLVAQLDCDHVTMLAREAVASSLFRVGWSHRLRVCICASGNAKGGRAKQRCV